MDITEFVPADRALWRSDRAKVYRCPECGRNVFSSHESDERATVECIPVGHLVRWSTFSAAVLQIGIDVRVTRELTTCLNCDSPLREIISGMGNAMVRTGQCPLCSTVYVLDVLQA